MLVDKQRMGPCFSACQHVLQDFPMQRGPKAFAGHLRPQEQSGDVPGRMSLVLSPALTPGVVSALAQHLQLAWPCA